MAQAENSWNEALQLGIPEDQLAECLEDIANQRLPPRPRRLRRRQVEAFAERLRESARTIGHLNIMHSDVLPGPRPSQPEQQFDRLLTCNPGYHLLLPEMLTHYANNLGRLEIGKLKPGTPKQRSPQEKLALELEVVRLILEASTGIDHLPGRLNREAGAFNGEGIHLQPSYRYALAANLIQAAYDAGNKVDRTAAPDSLRMAYDRRTLRHALKLKK